MNESIHLGSIAGIRIGINWSMLLIFWLLTWSLATGVFPPEFPGNAQIAYWGAAVVTTISFYVALLLHELSHSLVARRRGVTVEGITLWLFGGVSKMHGDSVSPGAEALIAVVGPLTSIVLGGVFFAAAFAVSFIDSSGLVFGALIWLAFINIVLGVFNLLPAFPLDGGRLLRAALWGRSHDRIKATVQAARVGQFFALLLIGLGLLFFFYGSLINGVWFAFLGWFLMSAARSEQQQVVVTSALAGVRVGDVMSRDPFIAPDWITIDEFITQYVLTHRFVTFPVKSFDGHLTGLVTLSQLKAVPDETRRAVQVRTIMQPLTAVPASTPDEPLLALLERMNQHPQGRALVFDNGVLVGIVSPSDIARVMQLRSLNNPR